MRAIVWWTVAALAVTCGCGGAGPVSSSAPEPKSEDEKAFYAMGIALSREVASLHMSKEEFALLESGLRDGFEGKPRKADPEAYAQRLADLANSRSAAAAADEKKVGAAFLERAAAEEGAKKYPSGLVMKTLHEGSGKSPMLADTIKVRYKGTLIDGSEFDSNLGEKEPTTVPLGRAIPCWTQALQLMKEGSKVRIACPANLAYGDHGLPPRIAPGAALIFEIELIQVGGS